MLYLIARHTQNRQWRLDGRRRRHHHRHCRRRRHHRRRHCRRRHRRRRDCAARSAAAATAAAAAGAAAATATATALRTGVRQMVLVRLVWPSSTIQYLEPLYLTTSPAPALQRRRSIALNCALLLEATPGIFSFAVVSCDKIDTASSGCPMSSMPSTISAPA